MTNLQHGAFWRGIRYGAIVSITFWVLLYAWLFTHSRMAILLVLLVAWAVLVWARLVWEWCHAFRPSKRSRRVSRARIGHSGDIL